MTRRVAPVCVPGRTFPRGEQLVAMRRNTPDRWLELPIHQRRGEIQSASAEWGDFDVRTRPLLSLFAASLIALAPFQAMAQEPPDDVSVQNRPRPEFDPPGMRLGGLNLRGTLDLAGIGSDNIFAEETGADDDMIFSTGIHGELSLDRSRHALVIDAGAVMNSYDDFSSEDSETAYIGAFGRLDIGSRSSVSARARFAHDVESRTDPDAPTTGDPVEYDSSYFQLAAEHAFNRFRVSVAAAQSGQDFDGVQNFRDYDERSLTGRLEAEVSPRIGLLLQATADERDYDNTPALNSDGQTYLVGATINLTDLMRGEVAVGQFERDYDSGISTDGLAVSGNVEWYVTRLTTLSFDARRNSEDVVGGNTALPYVESEYGARVDHEVRRNVILTAGVRAGRREYDVIDRDDEFRRVEAGADYIMNRRVAWRARYQYDEVESDGVDRYRDYDESRWTLGVSFRL